MAITSRVLADGSKVLAKDGDWAQICVYTDGRAMEIDLSALQMSAVALVLGLYMDGDGLGAAVGDDLLETEVMPALLEAIPRIWSKETMEG